MEFSSNICIICQKSNDAPEFYGDFLSKYKMKVHHFCLLFSHDLKQRGKDSAGFLGFMVNDIKKYVKGIRDKKCIYCNEKSASLKCHICKQNFHFICGIEKCCQFQFIGFFNCFCHLHIQIQHQNKHPDNQLCEICLQAVGKYNPVLSITPKCCIGKWFHRSCLMKYSLSAGYYVKCFWCQNKDFRDQIRSEGVFVPDRDASWEKQHNAYIELHRPYIKCNAPDCKCPKGREYTTKSGLWSTILCCMCGAYALHLKCFKSISKEKSNELICDDCCFIRTSRTLANEIFNDLSNTYMNNTIENTETEKEVSSNLDKSLYLIKTFNQDFDTNDQNEILQNDNYKTRFEDNVKILNEKRNNDCKMVFSDSIELVFENKNLTAIIHCYLKDPIKEKKKSEYTFDEISPIMINLISKSDSFSDLESDDDDEESIFLTTLSTVLLEEGDCIAHYEKQMKNKSNSVMIKNEIETYLIQSQINKSLKALIKVKVIDEKLINNNHVEIDKIEVKELLIYESEFDSDLDLSESDKELFEKIVESNFKEQIY